MSVVLGISSGPHDSGACLIRGGSLLRAVNEERFTRRKLEGRFPRSSIAYCLESEGLSVGDVDVVAHGWRFGSDASGMQLIARRIAASQGEGTIEALMSVMATYNEADRHISSRVKAGLAELGIPVFKLRSYDHHLCHAAAALYFSPFPLHADGESGLSPLCLTLDGRGDFMAGKVVVPCEKFRKGRHCPPPAEGANDLVVLDSITMFDSIGMLWAFVTAVLGFKPFRHEGKVTGLAASGNADSTLPIFERSMGLVEDDGKWHIRTHWHDGDLENFHLYLADLERAPSQQRPSGEYKFGQELLSHSRENVAAGLQTFTERFVCDYLTRNGFLRPRMCLAGGVFANVQLSMRIRELPGVQQVFVFPSMGDSGLCAGAAALAAREMDLEIRCPHGLVFLGPTFTSGDVATALGDLASQPNASMIEDESAYARAVAAELHKGLVVGLFFGPMEFGPRALGHRSLLVRATDASINAELNARLHRTEFMPFAPVTLRSHAGGAYDGLDAEDSDVGCHMSTAYGTTAAMRAACPAVVHVDGTARPQLVDERDGLYFHVLQEYEALSGVHSLVNTSFNSHEEPIVGTPQDAVAAFRKGACDVLALYPFLVPADSWQSRICE